MTAPRFRSLDQLTGEIAERPDKFRQALSEADDFIKELDGVRELRTRLQEVEAERDDLERELAVCRAETRQWKRMALGAAPNGGQS